MKIVWKRGECVPLLEQHRLRGANATLLDRDKRNRRGLSTPLNLSQAKPGTCSKGIHLRSDELRRTGTRTVYMRLSSTTIM